MTKYARLKDGHLIDVWRAPEDFPDTATRDRCLGADGWIEVPDSAQHGASDNGDGTYTNPASTTPAAPRPPSISRVRFDAVFAAACGEAYYLSARLALKAYAESSPLDDTKAAIARGLDALNNPPPAGIDYPFDNWKTEPNSLDITGALLRGIVGVLVSVEGFEDIEGKVDVALAAWAELSL